MADPMPPKGKLVDTFRYIESIHILLKLQVSNGYRKVLLGVEKSIDVGGICIVNSVVHGPPVSCSSLQRHGYVLTEFLVLNFEKFVLHNGQLIIISSS